MELLGIVIGPNYYNYCVEVNEMRVQQAERSLTDVAKKVHSSSISSRKEKEEEDIAVEGQLYGLGIAD